MTPLPKGYVNLLLVALLLVAAMIAFSLLF